MSNRSSSHKPVVGLVGGIGSGKSYVAQLLAQHGAHVIVADRLGHEALRQPSVRSQVFERWGDTVRDPAGEVDRRRLAVIVFASDSERKALEAMVFPWIETGIRDELARANQDPQVRFVVLDAAILLETGWGRICDWLVFVAAPPAVRQSRLAASRGWTAQELAERERAQWSLEEKAARADVQIDNSGDADETRRQVDRFVELLRRRHPSDGS